MENIHRSQKDQPSDEIHVTVKQKIMLHLMHYTNTPANSFNVSYDMTQDGISGSVGITRAHASMELKKLQQMGIVVTWKAHMLGSSSKRLAFALSPKGAEDAKCLYQFLRKNGIVPEMLLNMQHCNPSELWETLSESDRDVLGMACVLRVKIPRNDLPHMNAGTIPVDNNGLVTIPPGAARNYLSFATVNRLRCWHNWAADYWMAHGNYEERLYHLVMANRMKEAGRCVSIHHLDLEACRSPSLLKLLKKIVPEPENSADVYALAARVALGVNDAHEAIRMADRLASVSDTGWRSLKATAFARLGKIDEAKQLAITALAIENDPEAAMALAEICAKNNDLDGANTYSEKAAELTALSNKRRAGKKDDQEAEDEASDGNSGED